MAAETTYRCVADYFISLSNESQDLITNLKLQKLVYYSQAWYLAMHNKELIAEDFQAWVHGPVIPALYGEYKHFTWKPVVRNDLAEGSHAKIKSQLGEAGLFLEDIAKEYGSMSAYELELLTHSEDPWRIARKDLPFDVPSTEIITKDSIRTYYSKFVKNGQ
jgi:uncharacterized phage-associated protein